MKEINKTFDSSNYEKERDSILGKETPAEKKEKMLTFFKLFGVKKKEPKLKKRLEKMKLNKGYQKTIAAFRKKGLPFSSIAERLGISERTAKRLYSVPAKQSRGMSKGIDGKRYPKTKNPEKVCFRRKKVLKLREQNLSINKIAKIVGCSVGTAHSDVKFLEKEGKLQSQQEMSTSLDNSQVQILEHVKPSHSFFIPVEIQSQNKFNYKKNWKIYKGYRDSWEKAVGFILGHGDHGNKKQKVVIESIRKKILDYGNLVGGAKPIPDALIKFGWLKDDSPQWVEIEYKQRVVAKGEETGTNIEL